MGRASLLTDEFLTGILVLTDDYHDVARMHQTLKVEKIVAPVSKTRYVSKKTDWTPCNFKMLKHNARHG